MSHSATTILHNLTTIKSTFPLELQNSSTYFPAVQHQDHPSAYQYKLRSDHGKRPLVFTSPVYNRTQIPTVVPKPCSLPWKEPVVSHHQVEHSVSASESRLENKRRAKALLKSTDYDMKLKPTGVKRRSPIPIVKILCVDHQHGRSMSMSEQPNNKHKAGAPLNSSVSDMTPKPTGVKRSSPIPIVKILSLEHQHGRYVNLSEQPNNMRKAGASLNSSVSVMTPKPPARKRSSPIPIFKVRLEHQHGHSVNLPEPQSKNKRKAEAPLDSSASHMTPTPTGVMNEKRRTIAPLTSSISIMRPMLTGVQKIQRPPIGFLEHKLEDDHSVCPAEPRPFWMRL